jgi:hypothetical protein
MKLPNPFPLSSFLTFLALSASGTAAVAQTEQIPLGSVWSYLDNGSNQGTAWTGIVFDDSAWAQGAAELGYGDGGETTVVGFGSDSANKYTTTYFRHGFTVADPSGIAALQLDVQRDDGVVVYLNGTEIFRNNLPTGTITSTTLALTALGGADETALVGTAVDPALLVAGNNVMAAEIHQANGSSSDISFNLRLAGPLPASLTRGPYLQRASASQITVRWRTSAATDSLVRYGTDSGNLDQTASSPTAVTDHTVTMAGLAAGTRYYYSIGNTSGTFATGADYYFETNPVTGTAAPMRVWALGDSGTANANAAAVRDAFIAHNGGSAHADLLLMLGDNAYNDGTDAEFQAAVFNMYPTVLRNTVLYSTLGNHDGHSADSATQSGPYYDIHTLPTSGESGGLASGTEAYYSFDYANVHFVCLDSYETSRSANGAMATWLQNDLAATTQEWIIAFWHHPPYTKGSHNSDTEIELIEMRQNFLPILDDYGVDLVLGGHSHSYERSMLIHGHYGLSGTFSPGTMANDTGNGDPSTDGAYLKEPAVVNGGTVYAVAGSSGKTTTAALNHPVMVTNLVELGSMVLDIDGDRLDAIFLNNNGTVRDRFTILHDNPPVLPPVAPSDLAATSAGPDAISLSWADNSSDEDQFTVERSVDSSNWTAVAILPADTVTHSDTGLAPDTTYLYRVFASNGNGDSASSAPASATTDALPAFLVSVAQSETPASGTLNGDFTRTQADDGILQSITEIPSGGKPSKRYSLLSHTWQFNLPVGTSATLFANAYSGGSSDGDSFLFEFSTDAGASWSAAFTVSSTDPAHSASALLPGAPNGTFLVRVTDTNHTAGTLALDTVHVDELYVHTETVAGDPPAAPTNLSAVPVNSGRIDLAWSDNAVDELNFELERLDAGAPDWVLLANLPVDSTSYTDASVFPNSTHSYRIRAFNASGASALSNIATATTPNGISLQSLGYKVKGVINVDLTWSAATSTNVDIYRNGIYLTTVPNSGSFTDVTGVKGSATFTYRICEQGNTTICSNDSTVSL